MPRVTITLSDELFAELERVSAGANDLGFGPETWAQEAVESALATRRLPGVSQGRYGGRAPGSPSLEETYDPFVRGYRILLP
jgi:hypothetical protein